MSATVERSATANGVDYAPLMMESGKLGALVSAVLAERRVVGPLRRDGMLTVDYLEEADELELAPEATFASFKAAVFPARESILEYEFGQSPEMKPVIEGDPTVVFGMHPCDLHAMRLTDRVFAGGSWDAPADPNYLTRRRNLVVVGLDCRTPCGPESFCRDMGTLEVEDGYDALLVDLGDVYYVEIGTGTGAELFALVETQPADSATRRHVSELRQQRLALFPRRLEARFEHLPAMLRSRTSSRVWDVMGATCLACGSCTAVCPTCFCFDVVEQLRSDLSGGERCRIWDSCQLRSFALVAGGHNFRERQSARQRHFVMHKSAAIPDTYGVPGCVGCGRCATACPVDINQINIYNRLVREQ